MCVRFILAVTLWLAFAASAEPPTAAANLRLLSLRECIDLALSRNLDLQIQHLSGNIAGFNLSSSYGAYAPTFSVRAVREYLSQPGDFDPQKFNPDFPYIMNSDVLGAGLTGKLPLGFSYKLNAYGREDGAQTDFSSNPDDARVFPPAGIRQTNNFFANARVTVQQHLLKDFWIDADRETLLVRRKEQKMTEQSIRFQIMRTVLAVELSYFDLIARREEIRVQEKALELRQQLVSETQRRVKVGDLPPLDAEQAETQLQNTVTSLSLAREAFVSQQNLLKKILTDNFQEWADIDLQPSEVLLALQADVNRSESFQNALRNRPDLLEARVAIERSDVVVKYRYNQLFPALDLVGQYGGLGSDADLGSTVSDAFSSRNPEYFYGVVISLPLSNIGAKGSYNASKAAKQIAELQLRKAEQEVLWQVADLVNRAQSRFNQVGSTRKARTYAESALAAEQKKLANGLSTSFFVLQLQETLTNARHAELQAVAEYNKALAELAFADGTSLERHHLNLEVK